MYGRGPSHHLERLRIIYIYININDGGNNSKKYNFLHKKHFNISTDNHMNNKS